MSTQTSVPCNGLYNYYDLNYYVPMNGPDRQRTTEYPDTRI
ncbi:MAG: hypothetical protein QNK20_10185 [Aureibaculum sp.]|nr:hypothetical protein [Aureibaculum sp.]